MERSKRAIDSHTEQVHIVMAADLNNANRLFGGRLMEWIDVVGAIVGRRHSNTEVTTVAIDKLEFRAPAFMGDTIFMEGNLLSVGNSSMKIRVDSFVESRDGQRSLINRADMVFVAISEQQHPVRVPRLREDNSPSL